MSVRITPPSVASWGRMVVIGLVAVSLQWAWRDDVGKPRTTARDATQEKARKAHAPSRTLLPTTQAAPAPTPLPPARAASASPAAEPTAALTQSLAAPARANFYRTKPSRDARQVADWAVASQDNGKLPFFIIDKRSARLYVFGPDGRLRGHSTVLLGLAHGDETVPGIGDKKLSQIRAWERTTPAGRFVGELGRNAHGVDVVWIDYDAAVSMHRVASVNPGEHRLKRLASRRVADKRISYGCVNVPPRFFDAFVKPALFARNVVIYILPDTKPLQEVFRFDTDEGTKFRWVPQPMFS